MSRAATKIVDAEDGGLPQKGYKTVRTPIKRKKVVYLMRGVPASGKSFAARKLAGKTGVICETDSFFGPPGRYYGFVSRLVPEARASNMRRFLWALREGISPVVVDRGCGKGRRTWWYAKTAQLFGYEVKLAEPTSPWWIKMRNQMRKGQWPVGATQILFEKQKKTHRMSRIAVLRSLTRYDPALTIKKILREGK